MSEPGRPREIEYYDCQGCGTKIESSLTERSCKRRKCKECQRLLRNEINRRTYQRKILAQ